MPNIRAVRSDKGRSLVVTWKCGAETVIDVSQHIADYAAFAPLRADDDLFLSVKVGEWGWCVHWTDEMEISADTLWRLALLARAREIQSELARLPVHDSRSPDEIIGYNERGHFD
ncbi:MAG TPA: DUF2442 domain-containing protein [Stellaceae bacterium]|nr:DUF2442 domain-containing protein [Stellaceae bacterium]